MGGHGMSPLLDLLRVILHYAVNPTFVGTGGVPVCWVSCAWGIIAGSSLPLGAALGLWWPWGAVSKNAQGIILAFGAGFILYAVCVGIYGDYLYTMPKHARHTYFYISVACVCAMIGAYGYTWGIRMLGGGEHGHGHGEEQQVVSGGGGGGEAGTPGGAGGGKKDSQAKPIPPAALALYLGSFMDGVPEAVLIGLLATNRTLQLTFVLALFIANLPESIPSAAMLKESGRSAPLILGMWLVPCLAMGAASALSCAGMALIQDHELSEAVIAGVAAGALMAMAISVMLVEAAEYCGDRSGLIALFGFLSAVALQALMTYVGLVYGVPTRTHEATEAVWEAYAAARGIPASFAANSTVVGGPQFLGRGGALMPGL
mmetsp:Transcript_45738/g.97669  ORF Transcript_45738/g.97669 Transcript_45738/m.97669 type:complete len:373 (-) Transcript_45738:326-1444(-)